MAVLDQRAELAGNPNTAQTAVRSVTIRDGELAATSSVIDAGVRVDHCSVVQDSILYVFGGQLPPSLASTQSSSLPLFASLNLTSFYESSTEPAQWEELPSENAIPVLNPQCVLTGTHLLVVGGTPVDQSLINPFASKSPMMYCGFQAYSFSEQGWQSLLPQETGTSTVMIALNRTGHAATWLSDAGNGQPGLFLMGGLHYNGSLPANDAYVFDPFIIPAIGGQPIIAAQSIPNNLPPPTVNSGATSVNGGTSVLFFGGIELPSQIAPTSIWEFTPRTSIWKSLSASLPNSMPSVKTGWVNQKDDLLVIDISTGNTGATSAVIPLSNAGLRRRQIVPQSGSPAKMDGYSVAFDTQQNLAILSGGDGTDTSSINIFNATSNSWSLVSLQQSLSPTTTPSATPTSSLPSSTASSSAPSLQTGSATSTGFNKANLLAPIILGGILGVLGLLGLILLCISYRHRRSRKGKQGKSHSSMSPAGLWLKYGNRKSEDALSKAIGGEIFLRNLEEKHGLKRGADQGRGKSGWSKYFTTSWYHGGNNQRGSVSTSTTTQALVNETRDHQGPYGGGWDAESHYSKTSSFASVISVDPKRASSHSNRWSGMIRWSYNKRSTKASDASSGVLGSTLGTSTFPLGTGTGTLGAGGVYKL